MNSLICPISNEKINENHARVIAALCILLAALYLFTGNLFFLVVLIVDYYMRAFTNMSYLASLAKAINSSFGRQPKLIDRAQKIFAARVGLLLTSAAFIVSFFSQTAAFVLIGILMLFAFLEAVFNWCMGCVIYTFVIYPLYKKEQGLS